jgi:hypothetical protein
MPTAHLWRRPNFQLAGRGVVPGVERVLAAAPADAHPVEMARWFPSRDVDLVVGLDETWSARAKGSRAGAIRALSPGASPSRYGPGQHSCSTVCPRRTAGPGADST